MFPPLHSPRATLATFARLALLVAAPLHAQMMRGEIGVSAGVATDQRGFRSNAITLSPSVVLAPDPRLTAGPALSGTPFGSNARAPRGTGNLRPRLPHLTRGAPRTAATGPPTRAAFDSADGSLGFPPPR